MPSHSAGNERGYVRGREDKGSLFSTSTKAELCKMLGISRGLLGHVVARIDSYYIKDPRSKPDGGIRTLYKPLGCLRHIQGRIKTEILNRVTPFPFVHGGIRRRSIRTNASPHIGKDVVLAVDIKDCFPSIGPEKVLQVFASLGFAGEAARILTRLTTFEFQLPQGTSTSPAIANLALRRVDVRLHALAIQQGFAHTRFVDDITLSGGHRLRKFVGLVHKVLESEGFKLKVKQELMPQNERQTITKHVVNQKLNLPRERRAGVRSQAFREVRSGRKVVSPSTAGKLNWLKFINNEAGLRLLQRLNEGTARVATGRGDQHVSPTTAPTKTDETR